MDDRTREEALRLLREILATQQAMTKEFDRLETMISRAASALLEPRQDTHGLES
jgi:predicted translin family RNA/ssDNA-binding protein